MGFRGKTFLPAKKWTVPKASHRKASRPHFPRFPRFRRPHFPNFLTAPALQKHFVNVFFSCLPGNFALKKGGDFWWIFSGLRFPRNEAQKLLENFGENSEQNSGQNSGQKFKKFGDLSFCNFSDLKFSAFLCGRLPHTPIFRVTGETIHIFCVFTSSTPNCKMWKIRPAGLILTGIRCNGRKQEPSRGRVSNRSFGDTFGKNLETLSHILRLLSEASQHEGDVNNRGHGECDLQTKLDNYHFKTIGCRQ